MLGFAELLLSLIDLMKAEAAAAKLTVVRSLMGLMLVAGGAVIALGAFGLFIAFLFLLLDKVLAAWLCALICSILCAFIALVLVFAGVRRAPG